MPPDWDQDAFNAAADLVCRAGARKLEFGYVNDNDNVLADEADWYASAQYHGARIIVEHYRSPVDATEALARRLLSGGLCTHCRRRIALDDNTAGERCRWTRVGPKWVRGCEATHTARQPLTDDERTTLFGPKGAR